MRAGSSFTNFVTAGNVRQNPRTFEPDLYNRVGAVTGYPGPDTGVAAAAGNPGPKIVMKGGRKTRRGKKGKRGLKKKKTAKKHLTKKAQLKHRLNLRKMRRRSRKYLRDVRDLYSMSGGSPAEVPVGSSSNGYVQYMSNVPYTPSYSLGGKLPTSENALANPGPVHVMNNCVKK